MSDLKQEAMAAFNEVEAPEAPKEEPKAPLEEVEDASADDKETPEADDSEEYDLELEEEEEKKPVDVPPANQYVYDKLPTISVRGKLPDGRLKEFKIKIPDELPDDFEFASGKELAQYNAKVADQSNLAARLFEQYERDQQQQKYNEYQQAEERQVLGEMISLQNQGVLPKFKYKETDSRFNDDPAVKEMNKILKYRDEVNQEYADAGQMYRVPFTAAVKMYRADNPVEKKAPTKEAQERKQVASKLSTNGGTSAKRTTSTRRYPSGMSLKQIAMNEARIAGIE